METKTTKAAQQNRAMLQRNELQHKQRHIKKHKRIQRVNTTTTNWSQQDDATLIWNKLQHKHTRTSPDSTKHTNANTRKRTHAHLNDRPSLDLLCGPPARRSSCRRRFRCFCWLNVVPHRRLRKMTNAKLKKQQRHKHNTTPVATNRSRVAMRQITAQLTNEHAKQKSEQFVFNSQARLLATQDKTIGDELATHSIAPHKTKQQPS